MGTHSSGEDSIFKARKPYTITKQRERWTEGEHNKFLEALKLHGRAWQRIEELIGTKTAVQIRSHPQKFFKKLEKEADVNGVPIAVSIGIDIPPPRPKRKPSNPYPRNSTSPAPTWATSHVGAKDGHFLSSTSSSHCQRVANLQKELLHKRHTGEEKPERIKNQDGKCSGFFTLLKEDCSSGSPNNACRFTEFVPSAKEVKAQGPTNESQVAIELRENQKLRKTDAKTVAEDNSTNGTSNSRNNNNAFQKELVQGEKAEICALHCNPEDYKSFHHISSTFSSFIVSSLLQNPAAYVAARSPATFWPYANANNREDIPNTAAISAATAWWVTQGLLPLQTAFSCPPLSNSMTGAPISFMDTGQAPPAKRKRGQSSLQIPSFQDQPLDPKHSEAVEAQNSNNAKPNTHTKKGTASTEEVHDSNTGKSEKQVEGSSYGSNTPSGTEEETDTLEKYQKGNEELKYFYINHPGVESSH